MKKLRILTIDHKRSYILLIILLVAVQTGMAQVPDSIKAVEPQPVTDTIPASPKKDTTVKKHSPRTAAIRSAIVPGLGQIYNKKYWKVPIVYTALGITGYIFLDNIKTYREYRFAYTARYKAANATSPADSADYYTLKDIYQRIQPESIREARDRFRKYVDYSVLFFVLFWGLNVVDATVDAHLKTFDVSPDLSLHLKFKSGYSEMAGTNGVSLVLSIKDKQSKQSLLPSRF